MTCRRCGSAAVVDLGSTPHQTWMGCNKCQYVWAIDKPRVTTSNLAHPGDSVRKTSE